MRSQIFLRHFIPLQIGEDTQARIGFFQGLLKNFKLIHIASKKKGPIKGP